MTLVSNDVLLPCIDLIKEYQVLFSSQYKSLSLSFDSSYDKGIYDAINIAVKNSDSEFVAVCGAGDYFYLSIIESFSLAMSITTYRSFQSSSCLIIQFIISQLIYVGLQKYMPPRHDI